MMLDLYQLKKIKAETLCWGVAIGQSAIERILEIYPPLFDEIHVHAAHLFIDGKVPVNAVLAEEYSSKSPYRIEFVDSNFLLYRYDKKVANVTIRPAPPWYQEHTERGTPMSSIFTVHGARTLALAEYVRCDYINAEQGCQFCSVPLVRLKEKIRLKEISETYRKAYDYNPHYTVALSEGARFTPDRGALYHSEMLRVLKEINPHLSVSVELVPPEKNKFLQTLIQEGADSLIMNVEFLDKQIRKSLMPAKGEIPVERYYKAWEFAVSKLGWGQVSSVVILGVEPIENTFSLAKEMVKRGVIPTIMPFRPYDKAPMNDHSTTDPEMYMKLSDKVSSLMRKHKLYPLMQHGCAECGACSLEIDHSFTKPMKSTSSGWVDINTL